MGTVVWDKALQISTLAKLNTVIWRKQICVSSFQMSNFIVLVLKSWIQRLTLDTFHNSIWSYHEQIKCYKSKREIAILRDSLLYYCTSDGVNIVLINPCWKFTQRKTFDFCNIYFFLVNFWKNCIIENCSCFFCFVFS